MAETQMPKGRIGFFRLIYSIASRDKLTGEWAMHPKAPVERNVYRNGATVILDLQDEYPRSWSDTFAALK